MVTPISLGNGKPPPWPVAINRIHPMFRSLRHGLRLHLPMWEGGGAPRDISGHGNHAILPGGTNDPAWITWAHGRATQFATNDYWRVDDAPALDITNQITIAVWASFTNLSGDDGGIVSKGSDTTKYFGGAEDKVYELSILNDTLFFQLSDGSNQDNVSVASIGNTLDDGLPHQFVASWDSADKQRLYVDGVFKAEETVVATSMQNLATFLDIGGGGGSGDFPFDGNIGEVRLYDRQLSHNEIALLFAYPYGDITPWWNLQSLIGTAAVAVGADIFAAAVSTPHPQPRAFAPPTMIPF